MYDHKEADCYNKNKEQSKNYNFYGIYGHKEVDCYNKKKDQGEKGSKKSNKSNDNKKNNNFSYVFTFYSNSHTFSNDWIIYFGCTNHMYYEKIKVENFHKYRKDAIMIGDNSFL